MSSISIKVTSKKPEIINKLPAFWRLIEIDDLHDGKFDESFIMPVRWWSREDYEKQWLEGLERICFKDTSCLIASVQLPPSNPYINRWVLYKEKDMVYVQNQILVDENFTAIYDNKPFNLETCYDDIGPRKTKTDSDFDISEWIFRLGDSASNL